jgi:hypothetical protein
MTEEPADVALDRPSPDDLNHETPNSRRPVVLLAVVGVLALTLGVGYWFLRRAPTEPSAPAAAKKPSAPQQAQQEAGDQITLPPLEETDPIVRQLVGRLSSHPAVAAWLTTDGLILNFVMVTAGIANGEAPVGELKAVGPVGRFRTKTVKDNIYIDPASYRRYDRYGEAVSALDARGAARLYVTVKPRVRDGYRKLGSLGAEFDPVLERAIVELLRVPVVAGEVELEPKGIGYAFADARLERMSAAQKQLLRMGPENVRAVQNKLREISFQLGIPESHLPPP